MKIWTIGLVLLLIGCQESKQVDQKPAESRTDFGNSGSIWTVKHDGHLFVVAKMSSGTAMVVHPDDGK